MQGQPIGLNIAGKSGAGGVNKFGVVNAADVAAAVVLLAEQVPTWGEALNLASTGEDPPTWQAFVEGTANALGAPAAKFKSQASTQFISVDFGAVHLGKVKRLLPGDHCHSYRTPLLTLLLYSPRRLEAHTAVPVAR